METCRIITARISVPVNTLPNIPYSVVINLPAPIVKNIDFGYYSIGAAIPPYETGIRFLAAEGVIIPDMGSIDYLTNDVYVWGGGMSYSPGAWLSGEINRKISGPPYSLIVQAYNIDAAQVANYFITIRVTSEIVPPPAPIVTDAKKND